MTDHLTRGSIPFKGKRSAGNAVVLGGSMAGLLAARVLSDFSGSGRQTLAPTMQARSWQLLYTFSY